MENVEGREAHYGQGVLRSRHIPQIILQHLHQRTAIIYIPPDYPGGSQGVRRAYEPKIPQREDLLAHCGPEEGPNAG